MAVITMIGTALTAWIAVRAEQARTASREASAERADIAAKAERAAVASAVVADELKVTTAQTAEKLDEIHGLVNGRLGTKKRQLAQALRKVAELTGDPADAEKAEAAEQASRAHEAAEQASRAHDAAEQAALDRSRNQPG
ncbi:MAG: hypothetical protein K2X82_08480 [Gemmataceae bacterium]|nr:hypothetical protein [Gemmataceae bacterium]